MIEIQCILSINHIVTDEQTVRTACGHPTGLPLRLLQVAEAPPLIIKLIGILLDRLHFIFDYRLTDRLLFREGWRWNYILHSFNYFGLNVGEAILCRIPFFTHSSH